MKQLLSLLFTVLLASQADAQLFHRLTRPVQNCPGGICPSPNTSGIQWYNYDGLTPRAHVEQVHGLNTSGMSHEDILQSQNDYHNKYGSGHPVRQHTHTPSFSQKQVLQLVPVPLQPVHVIPQLPPQPTQILSINPNRWI